jgi:glycosyltransferase involved in cell wall biosynthesis
MIETLCRGDLYHATDFYLPLRSRKVVSSIHDVIYLAHPEPMVDHARIQRWMAGFVSQCRRVITLSAHSRSDITKFYGIDPARIDVVHPGVDHDTFRPAPDREAVRAAIASRLGVERPFFLAVSCSTGRKNTKLLLDAYRALLKNAPANDLVLVWNPPAEVRARYTEGELAGRVHFVGRQPDELLVSLYQSATALIFPSFYEGFGLPIAEAMACGTAAIASSASSMPEVGGDAAVYFDPADEASLVSALERCENDPKTLLGVAARGIEQAAKFTWARCAEETVRSYSRCLEEN